MKDCSCGAPATREVTASGCPRSLPCCDSARCAAVRRYLLSSVADYSTGVVSARVVRRVQRVAGKLRARREAQVTGAERWADVARRVRAYSRSGLRVPGADLEWLIEASRPQ